MSANRSALAVVPLALVALLALAGCGPSNGSIIPTAAPTSTPSPTLTPTTTPTPTPTVGTDTPLSIACDALITGEQMYEFNANYAPKPDYAPAAGSAAAQAVERGGIACGWVNLTSGDTIEFAAAQPAPEKLTALANELVVSSNSVPTFGVEGYFAAAGGVGVANAFSGPFWITATAATFIEPGDAEPLMRSAIENLG